MKKSSLTIVFAVVVFAIGSAFVTQPTQADVTKLTSASKGEMAQIGYYRIPNQPCGQIAVECNPVTDTDFCMLSVPGQTGLKQIYDSNCTTPLRKDP